MADNYNPKECIIHAVAAADITKVLETRTDPLHADELPFVFFDIHREGFLRGYISALIAQKNNTN